MSMDGGDGAGAEPDLAALMARVFPRLAALEEPVLSEAGLSMWEYTIMTELATSEVVSQAELSRRTRRDPTRLGRHLDDLESRDLVARARASDQRQLSVRLTAAGRSLYASVKKAVRTVEDGLLHPALGESDAVRLRQLLARLAAAADGGDPPTRSHP